MASCSRPPRVLAVDGALGQTRKHLTCTRARSPPARWGSQRGAPPRCKAHNAIEAERDYGEAFMRNMRDHRTNAWSRRDQLLRRHRRQWWF